MYYKSWIPNRKWCPFSSIRIPQLAPKKVSSFRFCFRIVQQKNTVSLVFSCLSHLTRQVDISAAMTLLSVFISRGSLHVYTYVEGTQTSDHLSTCLSSTNVEECNLLTDRNLVQTTVSTEKQLEPDYTSFI